LTDFHKKYPTSNFMKICPMGAAHAERIDEQRDGQTNGWTDGRTWTC